MISALNVIKLLFTSILFLCALIPVTAQSPPPPPPRIRLEAPKPPAPLSGPFESKEGGFKMAFPAMPTVQSRDSETSFGKTTMRVYSLLTSLASYSLVHIDFPTAIKEKFDLDTRFDAMRDGELRRKNGRLISESELYFGSHYGRDIVIEDTRSTHWLRAIMVEQRLFVMGVETKGNYATQTGVLKTATEARVKKFLDSFTVTEIPKPSMSAVELPPDFGVSMNGSTFTSTFLDVSLDVPKGWIVLESADAQLLLDLGKESISKTRPKLAEYIHAGNSRILLAVSKSSLETSLNQALLVIGVEKAPYPNFLALSAAKTYVASFLDKTDKVVKEPTIQKIGGLEFAWVETHDPAAKVYQRMYFANRKGVSFEFSLTYSDPADLAPMIRSLESLKVK